MPQSALDFLLAAQDASGGWGYAPTHASCVEPTAAVLISLLPASQAGEAVRRAVAWLEMGQHEDGGWGLNPKDGESNWQTAWATLALGRSGQASSRVRRGIEWLLNTPALQFTDTETLQAANRVAKIDMSLRGWPWEPGDAPWVEPTALAVLALQQAGYTAANTPSLEEALHYLVDRRCPGGGWNVGNPVMFDEVLPAHAHPTAWSLLALLQLERNSIQPADVSLLKEEMLDDGGIMALAWGLIALHALGDDLPEAQEILRTRQQSNGSWQDNPYLTALGRLALEGGW